MSDLKLPSSAVVRRALGPDSTHLLLQLLLKVLQLLGRWGLV